MASSEKYIFIDISCCADIDTEQLLIDLCTFYEGSIATSERADRYSDDSRLDI